MKKQIENKNLKVESNLVSVTKPYIIVISEWSFDMFFFKLRGFSHQLRLDSLRQETATISHSEPVA